MSQFQAAALGGIRAREGSPLIAKEFRLDERMRDGRAGNLDPGSLRPSGPRMHQLGKDIFARPALALQENGNSRIGSPFQLLAGQSHHRRLSEDHIDRWQIANIDKFG